MTEQEHNQTPATPAGGGAGGNKSVVVYIMVLFIAAFLLMAWSFASHQRSNTEALGRLQSSVTAMREVQDLQDQVIALQKELAEEVRQIMGTLPEKFQVPLLLYYLSDCSIEQIAAIIRKPPGTVKSRLFKGRSLMKKRLEDAGYEG